MFFFFKKKTAYEMRISDWSSDVCSSDLPTSATCWGTSSPNGSSRHDPRDRATAGRTTAARRAPGADAPLPTAMSLLLESGRARPGAGRAADGNLEAGERRGRGARHPPEIGSASCRERVGQCVWISGGPVPLKKKTKTT